MMQQCQQCIYKYASVNSGITGIEMVSIGRYVLPVKQFTSLYLSTIFGRYGNHNPFSMKRDKCTTKYRFIKSDLC